MSYIIGNRCDGVCDTACVTVCPVDCINGPIYTENMGKEVKDIPKEELVGKQLYINPETCIDCGACLVECPVDAIYSSEKEALMENDEISIHKNYNFYGFEFVRK